MHALVEDYNDPVYRAGAKAIFSNFLLKNKRLPTPVVLDTYIVHIKPWSQVIFEPKGRGGWFAILKKYYDTDAYKALNNAINGDPLLAKYASIHFLNTLLEKAEEEVKRRERDPQKAEQILEQKDPVQALVDIIDAIVQQNPQTGAKAVEAVAFALEDEAGEIRKDLEAVEAFSHIGVPVASLLSSPEEFRLRARNNIVVHMVRFLRRLRRESSGMKLSKSPTLLGGVPIGVKRMHWLDELVRIIPTEITDRSLFTYKLLSRQVLVRESYGGIPNTVVYLDKSGSMVEKIEYASGWNVERVPKISFAAASALALARSLRKMGAEMTLKLFDTEVHDPIGDFRQLVEVLLKIEADSGTNITRVLEDAMQNHRDDKVIIVTDGIDVVDERVAKRAKASGLDVHTVLIKTRNSVLEKYFPFTYLDKARPEVLLRI